MDPEIKKELEELISRFEKNESEYIKSGSSYNETELRSDFLNKFFEILGWDVLNERGLSKPFREVVLEANVSNTGIYQKPDYEFRFNGEKRFYLEAKKPSVDIISSKEAVYQTRRYGWSAGLNISVLSNFKNLSIYETLTVPNENDDTRVAKVHEFHYKDYINRFEEISSLISKEALKNGSFDRNFSIPAGERRGKSSFDNYFLSQIESWRLLLANDLVINNPDISIDELNYLIQVFINRIVFLRVCEDRNLEKYGTLKTLDKNNSVKELLSLFNEADKKYNSGLFDFIRDKLTPSVIISNSVLIKIVSDLYYPNSPYAFSVIDPKILGDIYEQFLARIVTKNQSNNINLEYKPEVKIANGVYTTPSFIVKEIVKETVSRKIVDTGEILKIKVADIACGSGIFLLEAYDNLLASYLDNCIKQNNKSDLRIDDYGDSYLRIEAKREILQKQIYGVDIDEQAVEVTKFSLLLKLLEDVSLPEINSLVEKKEKVLPSLEKNILCGNSIVDASYLSYRSSSEIDKSENNLVRPFVWRQSFPFVFSNGGFDVIVGNPPYTKIQHMVQYSPKEVEYYKSEFSPYLSAHANNFDKYHLFFERGVALLAKDGYLGYIIPHKFMTTRAGEYMRQLVASKRILRNIIHFGAIQVFEGQATTYTCIIIVQKSDGEKFSFQKVVDLDIWKNRGEIENMTLLETNILGRSPWVFVSKKDSEIISAIEKSNPGKFSDIAEIFVGIQTSADDIFFINVDKCDENYIYFKDKNGDPTIIEKGILKGAILDQSISPFRQIVPNKQLIFPYEEKNGKILLISEDDLKAKYPKSYQYLLKHKSSLAKRSMPNKEEKWYQFGRSQSLNKFNSVKIIIKNPASFACAVFDDNDLLFSGGGNGPYYGVRPLGASNVFFIMGLLNHPLFDKWVKLRSSIFRGEYYSFGKQFIEGFPIKIPTSDYEKGAVISVSQYWAKIIQMNRQQIVIPSKKEEIEQQKDILKAEANMILSKLYGLSEKEAISLDQEYGKEITE